ALRVDLKGEVRDHERQHDELGEGRYQLAGPPLRDEVFAGDRQRDDEGAGHWTMRRRDPGPSTRPLRSVSVRGHSLVASAWSCVASTAVLPRITAASSSAPSASRLA